MWRTLCTDVCRNRVRTCPGKPEKSWDFIIALSRTGGPLVLESSGNLLNSTKNMK